MASALNQGDGSSGLPDQTHPIGSNRLASEHVRLDELHNDLKLLLDARILFNADGLAQLNALEHEYNQAVVALFQTQLPQLQRDYSQANVHPNLWSHRASDNDLRHARAADMISNKAVFEKEQSLARKQGELECLVQMNRNIDQLPWRQGQEDVCRRSMEERQSSHVQDEEQIEITWQGIERLILANAEALFCDDVSPEALVLVSKQDAVVARQEQMQAMLHAQSERGAVLAQLIREEIRVIEKCCLTLAGMIRLAREHEHALQSSTDTSNMPQAAPVKPTATSLTSRYTARDIKETMNVLREHEQQMEQQAVDLNILIQDMQTNIVGLMTTQDG
eukprot:TRINITY_DN11980_c0_g4_i1.p1 TRINITY_DN11980_c0_g4~~TRINITY_DN11980_c0_g4_i1.p1  ORF type:complete len:335 (+),score=53.17 TRINITY_DN11980_c0_g4_i1:1179-2183(+)